MSQTMTFRISSEILSIVRPIVVKSRPFPEKLLATKKKLYQPLQIRSCFSRKTSGKLIE